MYVCIYIYIYICQDGGAVGIVDFTKLSFALSSLAQPFDLMESISEYVFRRMLLRRFLLIPPQSWACPK